MTEQETTTDDFDEEYADLGATTQEAMEIAETSMDIVRQFVSGNHRRSGGRTRHRRSERQSGVCSRHRSRKSRLPDATWP